MKLDVILVQHVIKQRSKDVSFNESEIEREFINTLLKKEQITSW